ncbi:heme utilization protein [Avibacterium sp. 21-599]|uniref:heme utilization protein n=1 Tax=Avibacterium sp. 21-599 TaxID=2911528 RepID=UPI00224826D0|nr:heme utilization protein [Avibacterium sp. 21-599]MCW9718565.1 heme utilization protein [Avibacterium sp. 21-599]
MKQGIYINGKQVATQIIQVRIKNMVVSPQIVSMVNGQLVVQEPQLVVDGQVIELEKAPVLHIEVFGDVQSIDASSADIAVTGQVRNIETVSGDVSVQGSVSGNVKTVSGDVQSEIIHGSVNTVSGDVYRDD